MSVFDKLLEAAEEGDREVLQKYPQLQDWDAKLAVWEDWKAKNWNPEANEHKDVVAAREILRQKDAEIEALKLMQGSDMNWDDLKGNVAQFMKDSGMATAADIEKAMETKFASKLNVKFGERQIPVGEYIQNVERGTEAMYLATADLPTEHFIEFGKPMKMADLWKYANENKMSNLQDAYAKMVAPMREQRATEAQTKREEVLRQTVREETLKEVTMKHGALPIDSNGSAPEFSPLTRKLSERKKIDLPTDAPKLTPGELGSQAASQDAYQQYIKDSAAGVKPKLPSWMQ